MTGKSKKRSDERVQQQPPEAPQRDASSEAREQPPAEHRYRSQRTDLLEGDPAGTAYSEEMGHTPTRE